MSTGTVNTDKMLAWIDGAKNLRKACHGLALSTLNLAHIASLARIQARISVSEVCGGEWSGLIVVAIRNQTGENEQTIQAVAGPCRVQIPGELARINFNAPDGTAVAAIHLLPLRKEIEPFIVGVGNVRTEHTPEGIVVIKSNDG